jgi:AbrB family looped-hinge helix DNA binding protein
MPKQATINREGQITVPREVRCTLRVRTGDKLLFESDGRVVRVQAVRRSEFSKYRGTQPRRRDGQKEHLQMAARDTWTMTTAVDTKVVSSDALQ